MLFLVNFLYVLLTLMGGLLLITLAWNPHLCLAYFLDRFLYYYTYVVSDTLRLQLALCGVLIIVLVLKYLESVLFLSRREKVITLESPEGRVSITLFAIEDMIARVLEAKKELSHVRPKVLAGKKIIEVIIKGNLTSDVNLMEFTAEIQRQLKDKLQSLLGEDKEIKVKIIIRKMVFGGKKKLVEEEPEAPFRNY